MSWCLRLTRIHWCAAIEDGEYEGPGIELRWRGWIVQLAIGRCGR